MTDKRFFDRRSFLKLMTAGTCGSVLHKALAPSNSFLALAAPFTAAAVGQKVLVILNMAGGASYNTAPLYHGAYLDKNPTVGYTPADSIPLSAEQGLHPSLTAFKSVYDEGHLALLNMVGYPNPNRSHDESTDIWFRGMRATGSSLGGWGARLTCQMQSVFSGVSLAGSNLLIQGDCNPPRSIGDLQNFGEGAFFGGELGTLQLRAVRSAVTNNGPGSANENQEFVRESMKKLELSLDVVKRNTQTALPVTFPNTGIGRSLRDTAKLIAANELNTQLVYVERGGFDTHTDERASLAATMTDINAAVTAFVSTMKAIGRWPDVTLLTMSEFCRTFENGSRGTDHGHAGPLFVMGGAVAGGIKSPPPVAADTAKGGFYNDYQVDFRQVFKEVIFQMGYNPDAVFPEQISYSPIRLYG